jgi:hypothetical protein
MKYSNTKQTHRQCNPPSAETISLPAYFKGTYISLFTDGIQSDYEIMSYMNRLMEMLRF